MAGSLTVDTSDTVFVFVFYARHIVLIAGTSTLPAIAFEHGSYSWITETTSVGALVRNVIGKSLVFS